jgi:hypothetical protein
MNANAGVFVSLTATTITYTPQDGTGNLTRAVTSNATITLNGKACKLKDLKPGDDLIFTGDPASTVAAIR